MIAAKKYPELIDQTHLLISRLERLSADSVWAHRASGVRGALLKSLAILEKVDINQAQPEIERLQFNLSYGFRVVENAAKEMLR